MLLLFIYGWQQERFGSVSFYTEYVIIDIYLVYEYLNIEKYKYMLFTVDNKNHRIVS